MNLELTDEEAAVLLRELNGIIDSDRYFLSARIKTLRAIRAKIRPEPVREPPPPPNHQGQLRRRDAEGAEDHIHLPRSPMLHLVGGVPP